MRFAILRGFMVAAFTFASLLPASYAQAAPAIDDAGAATLKAVVEDALSFYTDMHAKTGEGLSLSGPIVVTPKGSYYEVQIPGAAMTSDATVMNIGTVMINATPEDDGDYRASIAVPKQMVMKDSAGVERMVIDIGNQKFAGIFNPALGIFNKADASYDNVTATVTPKSDDKEKINPVTITLGNVTSSMDMTKDGDVWSGPQSTNIRNATMKFGEDKGSTLTIGELIAAVSYNKVDLAAGKKMRDQLIESMKSNGDITPETMQKLVDNGVGAMAALPESATSAFTLTDLALDIPAKKDTANAQPFNLRLPHVSSTSTLNGMKTDDGMLTSKSTLNGLTVSGFSGPLSGIIPSEAAFNIVAAKVPFKSIMANLGNALESVVDAQSGPDGNTQAAQDQAKLHAQQALATMPALLAQAGTTLTINDTFIKSSDLDTTLDGALTAVSTSPYIFAGKATLMLKGMDELITKLQEASRTTNNPQAAGYAQMLIIMQLSGQLSQSADGKSQRTYALELMPDGNVKLNGADMKALMPNGANKTTP